MNATAINRAVHLEGEWQMNCRESENLQSDDEAHVAPCGQTEAYHRHIAIVKSLE